MMIKQIHWYSEGGDLVGIESRDTPPDLKEMQDFVGGYVEHVTVLHNEVRADMFIHEMGRFKFDVRNEPATQIYFAATRHQGRDPENVEESRAETIMMAARMGIKEEAVIFGEPDGKPDGIYGPAILLVGFEQEEL